MKRVIALIVLVVLSTTFVEAGRRKDAAAADHATATWNYEVEAVPQVAKQGSVVVKVWSLAASPTISAGQAYKNAVHAVIFKGIPQKDRVKGKAPLVDAAGAMKHKAFFDEFFRDGGQYMMYATSSQVTNDILRISKKQYKVGVYVVVNYNALRSALEKAGVVKGLTYGF